MADPALGTRRRCASCSAPFYDLKRESIRCPKCDAPFVPEPPPRRGGRSARPRLVVPAPTPAEPVEAAPEANEDEDAILEPDADDGEPAEAVADVEEDDKR
jgi:uncharacterized protein (TIGR02300 family)